MPVCVFVHAHLFIYTFIHPSGVIPIAIILIAATQDLGLCPASPNSVAPTLKQLSTRKNCLKHAMKLCLRHFKKKKKSNITQDYPQKEVNMLEKIRTETDKPGYPYYL